MRTERTNNTTTYIPEPECCTRFLVHPAFPTTVHQWGVYDWWNTALTEMTLRDCGFSREEAEAYAEARCLAFEQVGAEGLIKADRLAAKLRSSE